MLVDTPPEVHRRGFGPVGRVLRRGAAWLILCFKKITLCRGKRTIGVKVWEEKPGEKR